jgi:hypothetical protein
LGKQGDKVSNIIQRRQAFFRYVCKLKGTNEVTMQEVAEVARKMGWQLPKPKDPMELFAKQFADAVGEETRQDKTTKNTYKANLAYAKRTADGKQLWLWFDVDEASRPQMVKGLHHYREHLVDGTVIGVNTAEHWNLAHSGQDSLPFVTDLTADVDERRATVVLSKKKVG